MTIESNIFNILVLTDEKTGSNNQALGVANKIGGNIEMVSAEEYHSQQERITGSSTRQNIVISASTETGYIAQRIKKLLGRDVFNIKLGPVTRRDYNDYDLIARYDSPVFQSSHFSEDPDKVMFTVGVAHRVTPELIDEGVKIWESQFSKFPHPRIGIMMGGSTSPITPFTAVMGSKLGKDLNALAKREGGSLIISTSRRTPQAAIKALADELTVPAYIHDWNVSQGNPHFGIMGISDYLISTGDSMSMLMEAASTGKPVYFYPVPEVEMPYHVYLQNELMHRGLVRSLLVNGKLMENNLETWAYTPPDIAGEIAQRAIELMQRKQLASHAR